MLIFGGVIPNPEFGRCMGLLSKYIYQNGKKLAENHIFGQISITQQTTVVIILPT